MRFSPTIPYQPLETPPPLSDHESVLAFSLAKAGSTLLYDLLRALAPLAGLTYFSVEDELFANDVSPNRRPANIGNVFAQSGFCYGGFRQFPAYPIPILHSTKSIFLVRDPRDMVVSLYFSMTKSHVLPKGEGGKDGARADFEGVREHAGAQSIDEWVERAAVIQYTRMFEGYLSQGFLWRTNIVTYRYEDVIFAKREWLTDICDWFGWDVPERDIARVAERHDIRPSRERPEAHIRQVAPGNFRAHLAPETIARLNGVFGEYMRLFGYEE